MSSAVDTPTLIGHRSALASIVETVIAPTAAETDRTGAYPRAALDALGAAGLLAVLMDAAVSAMEAHGPVEVRSVIARVMAPTTAALRDFVGRATLGQLLFGDA